MYLCNFSRLMYLCNAVSSCICAIAVSLSRLMYLCNCSLPQSVNAFVLLQSQSVNVFVQLQSVLVFVQLQSRSVG